MFALVLFTTENNAAAIVATNWLKYDGEEVFSYWPPTGSSKGAQHRETPGAGWKLYPCDVKRFIGKYWYYRNKE